ncbi:MAG TPA: GNAT family N-acetyltransferase [Blastocatellia bacterium]
MNETNRTLTEVERPAETGGVTTRTVKTARDLARFIDLPYRLYRHDAHWVAPLRMAQKDILDTKNHPFYKTSAVEMFLAERGDKVVGRIMAIWNRAHNEFHLERTGWFGFFEVENDFAAARELINAAANWLRRQGADCMRGPANPSANYELGLLVEGFDRDPCIMMTYNPPYYRDFLERIGLKKAMDLYAYDIDQQTFESSERLARLAEQIKRKYRLTIRTVNLKDFSREVDRLREVYNNAWSRNWGFIPVTPEEFEHLAKDLKQIVDPKVVYIAEKEPEDGGEPKPVGFFLAIPDVNQALKKINGRLLPFGIIKLLWHSRKIKKIRVITMGVVKELQNLGIAALFYNEVYSKIPIHGYPIAEMSWVLENNVLMNRAAALIGGKISKTYRIYEMPLS